MLWGPPPHTNDAADENGRHLPFAANENVRHLIFAADENWRHLTFAADENWRHLKGDGLSLHWEALYFISGPILS